MAIRPFPFGFIYSDQMDVASVGNRLSWDQIELPSSGQLWVSQDHPVVAHFEDDFSSIWIGHACCLSEDELPQKNIAKFAVETLQDRGWKALHEAMDLITGRFVAFIWNQSDLRIYHDATALRPVYFNTIDGLITSHAPLLRQLQKTAGKDVQSLKKLGQFKLWDETEDPDISALPANFYLDVSGCSLHRYYPHSPSDMKTLSEQERIQRASDLAHKSMEFWGSLPIGVYSALTAGLDTRMNAAAALGSGLKLNFVTYGAHGEITGSEGNTERSYKTDFLLTSQIANALHLTHTQLAIQDNSDFRLNDQEKTILKGNTFGSHALNFQGQYEATLGKQESLCFVGTAFEGMRDYYVSSRRPLSPFEEFKSTLSILGGFKNNIRGYELNDEIAAELWDRYDIQSVIDNNYPISNILYIELRSGRFQSEAINCQATAFLPVNPLAIRAFLEIGQAYSYLQRKNADFLYSFIEYMYPAVSAFPVNQKPKHLPAPTPLAGICVKKSTNLEASSLEEHASQNRNDRICLESSFLQKGASKWFEKSFTLETGSLDISLLNYYFLGRASTNLELFVSVNHKIVDSTPIGLRRSPFHFHIEGLKKCDVVQAGIRTTEDLGPAWVVHSIVDLLDWSELPDSAKKTLAYSSTIKVSDA